MRFDPRSPGFDLKFLLILLAAGLWTAVDAGAGESAELSRTVLRADDLTNAVFDKGAPRTDLLPDGGKTLRFDEPFNGRIDLKPLGVDSRDFDLIKMTVKADPGAFMRIAVENHPRAGDISYWYPLDSMNGPFDWKTIWVDLRLPEEAKSAGDPRSPWREGMGKDSDQQRGLRIEGSVKDLKNVKQGPDRRIQIRDIRFVKEAVHLDWDQAKAPFTWGKDRDLVYTYPLTLSNRLARPVTARLALTPLAAGSARGKLEGETVPLEAGQSKTVEAQLILPGAVAARQAPLYCERFLVTARAEGIEDSEVTVLRSSDPIHLSVTVPIPEEKLQFPLFPRPNTLPAAVTRFDEKLAREHAARDPEMLITNALGHGLYQYDEQSARDHHVNHYRQALVAATFLYDATGEEQYLRTARRLLEALPAIWSKWEAEERRQPIQLVSNGIVARWGERSHGTLGLGWLVMGTTRGPYYYGTSGNGEGGGMSSLAYAFDIIAPRLDDAGRRKIIEGFFLPAGIRTRNHYVGDGNQQMTADVTALYAGLMARNWPLVSFAYSSEHGLQAVLDTCFDDAGVQLRKNYQTYTLRPVFWALELLHGAGVDDYKRLGQRLTQLANADTAAKGQGRPFEDREFWEFVRENRLR